MNIREIINALDGYGLATTDDDLINDRLEELGVNPSHEPSEPTQPRTIEILVDVYSDDERFVFNDYKSKVIDALSDQIGASGHEVDYDIEVDPLDFGFGNLSPEPIEVTLTFHIQE